MDEQGQRQPIGLFTAFGINVEKNHLKEKDINAEEEIRCMVLILGNDRI